MFSFGFIKAFDSKQGTCKDVQGLRHQQGLWCVKYILFWFYRSVGFDSFEGNIKFGKRRNYVSHAIR